MAVSKLNAQTPHSTHRSLLNCLYCMYYVQMQCSCDSVRKIPVQTCIRALQLQVMKLTCMLQTMAGVSHAGHVIVIACMKSADHTCHHGAIADALLCPACTSSGLCAVARPCCTAEPDCPCWLHLTQVLNAGIQRRVPLAEEQDWAPRQLEIDINCSGNRTCSA